MVTRIVTAAGCMMLAAASAPGMAQTADDARAYRQMIGASIVSDIVRERQADRDAQRYPYATADMGDIRSAAQASAACGAEAVIEAGQGARLAGQPVAASMATGWEVEGHVSAAADGRTTPFICSVRNGSVSGLLLK